MGLGFGGCGFNRCDCCVGGYGDGPCGGYYSYWDRYRCNPRFNRRCGCGFPFGFNNFCCSPGWRNPCGGFFCSIPCGCCNLGFFLPF